MPFLKRRTGAASDPLIGKPASFGIHRYLQGSANLFEENRLLKFAISLQNRSQTAI
jgi:conjugal transfer pilus assembly protein TraE